MRTIAARDMLYNNIMRNYRDRQYLREYLFDLGRNTGIRRSVVFPIEYSNATEYWHHLCIRQGEKILAERIKFGCIFDAFRNYLKDKGYSLWALSPWECRQEILLWLNTKPFNKDFVLQNSYAFNSLPVNHEPYRKLSISLIR